ncbi:MAG: acyl carrier protein [Lachnospiraceae bacterium]|nr:acyl carrier protein [Lachnospiraceae bacterium]
MLEKITELLVDQLGVDASDVKGDTSFKDDLGADSLDLFEMVMNLEEEYGIEVPAEELENIETVNDMIEYLESKGITE